VTSASFYGWAAGRLSGENSTGPRGRALEGRSHAKTPEPLTKFGSPASMPFAVDPITKK